MTSLVLWHCGDQAFINEISSTIDFICEETGCQMGWGDPTEETISWKFLFKTANQKECAKSMLLDLVHDYPNSVVVT